jgi:hypothetical protein
VGPFYYDSTKLYNNHPAVDGIDKEELSDKEQEISRLKDVARKSYDKNTVRSAIDKLTMYGKDGIKPITDIIEAPVVDESMKEYGLNAIKRIRIFTPFNP